jgi:hypothetical protein
VKRRQFIAGLASTAVAWPVVALGQQAEQVRRIGVLSTLAADDPDRRAQIEAFLQGFRGARKGLGAGCGPPLLWDQAPPISAFTQSPEPRLRLTLIS